MTQADRKTDRAISNNLSVLLGAKLHSCASARTAVKSCDKTRFQIRDSEQSLWLRISKEKRAGRIHLSKQDHQPQITHAPLAPGGMRDTFTSNVRLHRGIGQLVTMAGAMGKEGRRVQLTDLSVIDQAAFVEQGGRLQWVGREMDLPNEFRQPGAIQEDLDHRGAVIIPALIECHTHLIYSGNRAAEFERRNRGETYQQIARAGGGIMSTVRATRASSEEELAVTAQKRVDRFISQGVATIEAKSGYGLTIEDEFKMLRALDGVRSARMIRTFLGAHAIPPESPSAETWVDELIHVALPRLKSERLACRVDIFTESGYFDKELSRRYLAAARALGFDLVVHADQLTHSGGAALAVELGARSAEHLICIDAVDIAGLAASNVSCVLLPSADLYLNCPYPPARALIGAGARVAIATDFNPGSSPSQDIALAGVLARIQMKMSLEETLAAYTVGAAFALGLEKQLGSLEVGKFSDFIVLSGNFEELFLEVGLMPIGAVYREGQRIF
jgi:imidazolonepropionase